MVSTAVSGIFISNKLRDGSSVTQWESVRLSQ